jgi:hypothetical protein
MCFVDPNTRPPHALFDSTARDLKALFALCRLRCLVFVLAFRRAIEVQWPPLANLFLLWEAVRTGCGAAPSILWSPSTYAMSKWATSRNPQMPSWVAGRAGAVTEFSWDNAELNDVTRIKSVNAEATAAAFASKNAICTSIEVYFSLSVYHQHRSGPGE